MALHRAIGHILFVLPAGGIMLTAHSRRRGPGYRGKGSVVDRPRDAAGPVDHRPALNWPPPRGASEPARRIPPVGESGPKPGQDSRIWDHDAATVFANVYRLGHRSSFSWDRLIRHLDPDLWRDIVAARAAREAARDAEPLRAEAGDVEADRGGVHVPPPDPGE